MPVSAFHGAALPYGGVDSFALENERRTAQDTLVLQQSPGKLAAANTPFLIAVEFSTMLQNRPKALKSHVEGLRRASNAGDFSLECRGELG